MAKIYEFAVDEVHIIRCRYQIEADSEAAARNKAQLGDAVQIEVEEPEELVDRTVGELIYELGEDGFMLGPGDPQLATQ